MLKSSLPLHFINILAPAQHSNTRSVAHTAYTTTQQRQLVKGPIKQLKPIEIN